MPVSDSLLPRPIVHGAAPLPLHGVTILLVEDSVYASEALRLMALRSGARLRRATDLADARRHLTLYRPDAVLVDIGLPDGSGTSLIGDLAKAVAGPVVFGLSGDPDRYDDAMAAGAQDFLCKPFPSLAEFQSIMLAKLPGRGAQALSTATTVRAQIPDPLALREDLTHAAGLLHEPMSERQRDYLSGFLGGLARATRDPVLAQAAAGLPRADDAKLTYLAGLVARRIASVPSAFAARP